MSIAVVVPTIRYDTRYQEFLQAWETLFTIYQVHLITVEDGIHPIVHHDLYGIPRILSVDVPDIDLIMEEEPALISCLSPACRNLGFAYIARYLPQIDIIITLDDDLRPGDQDPIEQHITVLGRNVPVSWMSSTLDGFPYMRGFPYDIRHEAEVWVSHGVWEGVPDLDAVTQLSIGERPLVSYYRGPIPKGVLFPVSSMNLACRREALPWMYMAPVVDFPGCERFDDIWMGIHLKFKLDELGKAMVTGYSVVEHDRASNVFVNLNKEHLGLQLNETYWEGWQPNPWFKVYDDKRLRWERLIQKYLEGK